jgi:hypothetical protein
MKKVDLIYYLFLVIILTGGVSVIILLYPNKNLQFLAACALSFMYAAYGIIHHYLAHNLVGKIMVEYILVAMLGVAISFFIFRGGIGF